MLLAAPFEFLGGHVTPVSQDFVCDLNFSGQCFPPGQDGPESHSRTALYVSLVFVYT